MAAHPLGWDDQQHCAVTASFSPVSSGETLTLGRFTLPLLARPLLMGVLNVTPDSFSDSGRFADPDAAVAQFGRMVEEGAEIIDLGGESSRPGAESVDAGEEWRRVGAVLARVAANSPVPISIDTYKAEIARRAIDSGAVMVNDISALRFDPEMAQVVAETGVTAVLMHMLGTPRTMQQNPEYHDVVAEICSFLEARAQAALAAGVPKEKIMVDPGIGFGKTLFHNLLIIGRLKEIVALGYPVLVGASRKSFIGKISGVDESDRLEGSLAAAVLAACAGARIIRTHDVRQTRRALEVCGAVLHPARFTEN